MNAKDVCTGCTRLQHVFLYSSISLCCYCGTNFLFSTNQSSHFFLFLVKCLLLVRYLRLLGSVYIHCHSDLTFLSFWLIPQWFSIVQTLDWPESHSLFEYMFLHNQMKCCVFDKEHNVGRSKLLFFFLSLKASRCSTFQIKYAMSFFITSNSFITAKLV